MGKVLSQEEGIKKVQENNNRMYVAKIPHREKVTKVVPGQEYFCSDEGINRVAEEGMAYITRELPDGSIDGYLNKKGAKYTLEDGKTWDSMQPGESAYGKLGEKEYDRSAIWVAEGTESMAVWDEVQKAQGTNAFLTTIYESNPNSEDKWTATQTVINNNPSDIHPIDIERKDANGNPVVIGELPLTASPEAREKEFREYMKLYYPKDHTQGTVPKHLLPVIRNINAEKYALVVKSKMLEEAKGRRK